MRLRFLYIILIIFTCKKIIFAQYQNNNSLGYISLEYNHYRLSIDSIKKIQKDTIHISFPFKNTGKKSLTIKEVKTSCSCSAGNYPINEIKVGKNGVIVIKTTKDAIIQNIKLHAIVKSNASNDYVVLKIIPY